MTSTPASAPVVSSQGHTPIGAPPLNQGMQRKGVDAFFRGRLNLHADDLQHELNEYVAEFIAPITIHVNGVRHDMRANGMLSEIVAATSVLVYDLPALKMQANTAFVDTTGRMYFCDTFLRKLIEEQRQGKDSLNFVMRHEAEHLRRLHLQRMLSLPHSISNEAQDIRINLDIVIAAVSAKMVADNPGVEVKSGPAFDAAVKDYLDMLGDAVRSGCGLTYAEYLAYKGMSEEAIGAELMKNYKPPQQDPSQGKDQEASFPAIMEGAAQDLDAISSLAVLSGGTMPNVMPAQLGTNAKEVPVEVLAIGLAAAARAIGTSKGKASIQVMDEALYGFIGVMDIDEMTGRDLQHASLQAVPGQVVPSVKTGDAYVDGLSPRERIMMAAKLLNMILNPSPGDANKMRGGGLKIKDLEAMLGKAPKSDDSSGQDQAPSGSQPGADSTPENNVKHGGSHVMTAEEVARILKDAGLGATAARLGYDDANTIAEEKQASKDTVSAAVNKAQEDIHKVGASRIPGGHLAQYASAKLNDFFKPVLTWKMAVKELADGVARSIRYEETEPWANYYVDHTDMGLATSGDIPYCGSFISASTKRPVLMIINDTSGSVTDGQLKRFYSESLHAAQDNGSEASPEVIIMAADTICRGDPVFVTADNVEEHLKKGVNFGGRGGTSFQASLEHVYEMFRPDTPSELSGRRLDGLAYFTDSFDAVPDQPRLEERAFECGFQQLPTTVFLVPSECYNPTFEQGVKDWAKTIFFDARSDLAPQNAIDMEAIESDLAEANTRQVRPD